MRWRAVRSKTPVPVDDELEREARLGGGGVVVARPDHLLGIGDGRAGAELVQRRA